MLVTVVELYSLTFAYDYLLHGPITILLLSLLRFQVSVVYLDSKKCIVCRRQQPSPRRRTVGDVQPRDFQQLMRRRDHKVKMLDSCGYCYCALVYSWRNAKNA